VGPVNANGLQKSLDGLTDLYFLKCFRGNLLERTFSCKDDIQQGIDGPGIAERVSTDEKLFNVHRTGRLESLEDCQSGEDDHRPALASLPCYSVFSQRCTGECRNCLSLELEVVQGRSSRHHEAIKNVWRANSPHKFRV
jgi:hypothetical protein